MPEASKIPNTIDLSYNLGITNSGICPKQLNLTRVKLKSARNAMGYKTDSI